MKIHLMMFALLLSACSQRLCASECVVLIHGLLRSSASMVALAGKLESAGYVVVNVDYPSRKMAIEKLADIAVANGVSRCAEQQAQPINFVSHSLGGILVRQYYQNHAPENVHRVVMLGPPNQGSEVVDKLKNAPGFELLNGPAGMQLGTDSNSIPASLGAVNFELGVIAGTQSINLILSSLLPGRDDGKVSVANTKVTGMCGFVALPTTHPFMMKNETVIAEVVNFLKDGKFKHENAVTEACAARE